MIEEQFVSFDTARMLKEAGFEANLKTMYVEEEKDEWAFWDSGSKRSDYNYFDDTISCPTQALAARWLREKHRIVVDVTFIPPSVDGDEWQYFIGEMDDMVWEGDFESSDRKYSTYEEAFEAGLQEAIKLITSENENRNNRC